MPSSKVSFEAVDEISRLKTSKELCRKEGYYSYLQSL
jgi:hypothetical protein